MVNLLTLGLIFFIFLIIYQNVTLRIVLTQLNLGTYFFSLAILKKYFLVYVSMSLHFWRSLN